MRVEVLRHADQIAPLGDEWDRLGADFDAPVVRHDWVLAAVETLEAGRDVRVVCVFDGADLVAAAALSRPSGPLGRLGFAGQHEHDEPSGFVYRDAAALGHLVDAVAALRLPVLLRGVAAGSPVVPLLAARSGRSMVGAGSRTCPVLELPTGAATDQVLSKSLRTDLRRARRRATEFGEVSFEMHTPASTGELAPLWGESVRIEAAGWKGRSGTALRHHRSLHAFFVAYTGRAAQHKDLRVGLLRYGGEGVSALIATEWNHRLWLLKMGYDERFASSSPGMLLLEGAVGYAVDHGLRSVEFLGSAAPWTRRWTRDERALTTVKSYPATVAGVALLGRDSVRRLGRRVGRPVGSK